jgi:hypothetical protein
LLPLLIPQAGSGSMQGRRRLPLSSGPGYGLRQRFRRCLRAHLTPRPATPVTPAALLRAAIMPVVWVPWPIQSRFQSAQPWPSTQVPSPLNWLGERPRSG